MPKRFDAEYLAKRRDPSPLDLDLTTDDDPTLGAGPSVATDAGREEEAEEL